MPVNRRIVLAPCLVLAALSIGCGNNPCDERQEAITRARAAKGCEAVIKPYVAEDAVNPDHCPTDRPSEERIACEATVFLELTDCALPDQVTQFQADMALCASGGTKNLTARAGSLELERGVNTR